MSGAVNGAAAVERQRRYRERRAAGVRVVPVEVDREIIAALIASGDLEPGDASTPAGVGEAVASYLERMLGR